MKTGQNLASLKRLNFESKVELEQALAKQVAGDLNAAILTYGEARMLLSGGSTPFGMYRLLADQSVDWEKVCVGLVDERMVAISNESSNFRSLQEALQEAHRKGALLLPMAEDVNDFQANLAKVNLSYKPFMERIDIVVLGMGNDGHTASLFPGDDASEEDLASNECRLLYTIAPSEPRQRITCSKGMLVKAKQAYLMFVGEAKVEVFEEAKAMNYPIHQLCSELESVAIYYTN